MMSMRSLLLLFSILSSEAFGGKVLHLESAVPINSRLAESIMETLNEALEPLNYRATALHYPSKRGLELLRNRGVDGSLGRSINLKDFRGFDGIIRIEVPVAVLTASLWCRDDPKNIVQQQKKLKIAYRGGVPSGEAILAKATPEIVEKIAIHDTEQSIRMVEKGRADCCLETEMSAEAYLAGSTDRLNKMPYRFDYMNFEIFPYLQREFQNLIPEIEANLRRITSKPKWIQIFGTSKVSCSSESQFVCADGVVIKKSFSINH